MNSADETIRDVLDKHGRLPVPTSHVGEQDNLYDIGLSSHASVNVMLALEDAFDAEFPDSLLRRETFESIVAIRSALASMGVIDAPEPKE